LFVSYIDFVVLNQELLLQSILLVIVLDAFVGIIAQAWILSIGLVALSGAAPTLSLTLTASLRAYFPMLLTRVLTDLLTYAGLLLCVIPGIYLMVRLVLAECAVVAEGAAGVDAIRRSFQLTRGYFWFIFLIGVMLIVITIVGGTLTLVPVLLNPGWDNWIVDAFSTLALDLIGAYFSLCFVCVYFRLRGAEPGSALNESKTKSRGPTWPGGDDDYGLQ
jgi:hypothetical protein